jgi:2'-5' RNA ligase
MSFLGIAVPHEISRLLASVDVEGDSKPSSSYHITLFYMGDNVPVDKLSDALAPIFEVTSRTPPFTVETSEITSFPPKPDGVVPVVARIVSNDLLRLRAELKVAFDEAGVEYSKTFFDYRPHVSLAMLEGGERPADIPIRKVEWGVGEIVLWGGDYEDDKLIVTFPLVLNPEPTT